MNGRVIFELFQSVTWHKEASKPTPSQQKFCKLFFCFLQRQTPSKSLNLNFVSKKRFGPDDYDVTQRLLPKSRRGGIPSTGALKLCFKGSLHRSQTGFESRTAPINCPSKIVLLPKEDLVLLSPLCHIISLIVRSFAHWLTLLPLLSYKNG